MTRAKFQPLDSELLSAKAHALVEQSGECAWDRQVSEGVYTPTPSKGVIVQFSASIGQARLQARLRGLVDMLADRGGDGNHISRKR